MLALILCLSIFSNFNIYGDDTTSTPTYDSGYQDGYNGNGYKNSATATTEAQAAYQKGYFVGIADKQEYTSGYTKGFLDAFQGLTSNPPTSSSAHYLKGYNESYNKFKGLKDFEKGFQDGMIDAINNITAKNFKNDTTSSWFYKQGYWQGYYMYVILRVPIALPTSTKNQTVLTGSPTGSSAVVSEFDQPLKSYDQLSSETKAALNKFVDEVAANYRLNYKPTPQEVVEFYSSRYPSHTLKQLTEDWLNQCDGAGIKVGTRPKLDTSSTSISTGSSTPPISTTPSNISEADQPVKQATQYSQETINYLQKYINDVAANYAVEIVETPASFCSLSVTHHPQLTLRQNCEETLDELDAAGMKRGTRPKVYFP